MLVYDSSAIVPEAGWAIAGKDRIADSSVTLHAGRPDLLGLLDQLLAEQQATSPGSAIGGGAVLLSCGPASLVSAVSSSHGSGEKVHSRRIELNRILSLQTRSPGARLPSVGRIWRTKCEFVPLLAGRPRRC